MSKVYEYVLIFRPTAKERKDDDKKDFLINGGVNHVLAKDEAMAAMVVAREIPNEYEDRLDQVEIAIRPF